MVFVPGLCLGNAQSSHKLIESEQKERIYGDNINKVVSCIILQIMSFNQNNFKSNFLQKKKQEKKKQEDQTLQKVKTITIQKNIRAFLQRSTSQSMALRQSDIPLSLLLSADLSQYPLPALEQFWFSLSLMEEETWKVYLKRLIIGCLKVSDRWEYIELGLKMLYKHKQVIKMVVEDHRFTKYLQTLLQMERGSGILNITIKQLVATNKIKQIKSAILLQTALKPYQETFLDIQGIKSMSIQPNTLKIIFQTLAQEGDPHRQYLQMMTFNTLGRILLDFLNQQEEQEGSCAYMIHCLRELLIMEHQKLVEMLSEKNKQLFHLIEDEEDLEYFQNRSKQQPEYVEFSEETLFILEKLFKSQTLRHLMNSVPIKKQIDILIAEMNKIYESRKIVFIQAMLSSDETLQHTYKERNPIFYEGLKMKLLTMDDQQFRESQLFPHSIWKQIIQGAIVDAYELTKKSILNEINPQKVHKKLIPFMKRNESQLILKTLSEILNNLYKKCLRTQKISPNLFVNQDLDKMLNTFKFGVGARTIEYMLKNFPFSFRFQSRFNKLKEFIKNDKKNYDRSLFLQEEIDDDLIITVRRGNQFLDAFNTCMNRDLRKKYKIIFYNEQGLEEEGIDGGGIIKQFVNRVLKASFSHNYGLFYENSSNQILPNPYSPSTQQYEFVGRIVGKAVYEAINIEQKFAEPFLNLVIGRQNSFEDLQYIDDGIYKSLVEIKNMERDVIELQQTFVILDQLPNGIKKYVNLKNPSVIPTQKDQIFVTNDNKMEFVMSYSDYKCNRQLQEKTRFFRKGFLKVMKSQWLSMFNNEQLNLIISGSHADYSIDDFMMNVVYNGYHAKDETITMLWQTLREFNQEEKALFLHFITSCSRPPTLGFAHMKPLVCIDRMTSVGNLPTANTCMNVFRLPDYKDKKLLREKVLYAIKAKAGFEFA